MIEVTVTEFELETTEGPTDLSEVDAEETLQDEVSLKLFLPLIKR